MKNKSEFVLELFENWLKFDEAGGYTKELIYSVIESAAKLYDSMTTDDTKPEVKAAKKTNDLHHDYVIKQYTKKYDDGITIEESTIIGILPYTSIYEAERIREELIHKFDTDYTTFSLERIDID